MILPGYTSLQVVSCIQKKKAQNDKVHPKKQIHERIPQGNNKKVNKKQTMAEKVKNTQNQP